MNEEELKSEIGALLRGLRSCDTQPEAIKWMTRAYKAMESALQQLNEVAPTAARLVFVPARPKLEIVPSVSLAHIKRSLGFAPTDQTPTVIYPQMYLHPGLKRSPKAWPHADTLRFENATNLKQSGIQKRGR